MEMSVEYPWTGNWMYTAQRWTGGIAFAYILWHTYTMRFTGVDLHAYPEASFGKVQAEVFQTPFFLFYVVGLIAASWHFAYGIWLFSAKWGIVSGEKARKRFLAVCLAFFFVLTARDWPALLRSGPARSSPLSRGQWRRNRATQSILQKAGEVKMAASRKLS